MDTSDDTSRITQDGYPFRRRTSRSATARFVRIVADRLLHAQRGVAGAHGVIFVGQRRPEQGHDAVAHDLVYRSFIPVYRLDHVLEYRVEQSRRFFWIAVGEQLH
jgi:hypothetical protein